MPDQRLLHRLRRVALWALALAVPVGASAGPGDHIKVGDAEIAPDLDLGFEYRTNVARVENEIRGGFNMRLAPGLRIGVDKDDVSFNLGGEYELRKYLQPQFFQFDRYNDFNVDMSLDAFKRQRVGFRLSEMAQLRNLEVRSDPTAPFNTQIHNDLRGAIVIRPGQILEITPGGAWVWDQYLVPNNGDGRLFNTRNSVGGTGEVKWSFFPRTAVVANVSVFQNYWGTNLIPTGSSTGELGSFLAKPNSLHFHALAGVRGRLTERFVLVAMIGYGSARYSEESVTGEGGGGAEADPATAGFDRNVTGVERLVGQLEGRFDIGQEKRIKLGYAKDFDDSFFTNYYAYNKFYAGFDGRFGQYFGAMISADASLEDYHGEVERFDVAIGVKGDASVYFRKWASVTAGVYWTERSSNQSNVEYDDVNIHVLSTFTY